MGLARTLAVTLTGLAGHIVEVEAHAAQGLPGFTLVGLPDAAVRESRERVRAALSTCGVTWGEQRLTVNLSPADLRKTGTGLDLALALAVLGARGRLGRSAAGLLGRTVYIGELRLGGSPAPGRGGPCRIAGITYRQLDYWARTGLVEPSVRAAKGSGSQRLYAFRDILLLKIVKRLLDTGVSLQQIRTAVKALHERGVEDLTSMTLMSDGASVYECTSADEVVDLVQGGQGVFGIAVGRVWHEIEGSLAELPVDHAGQAPVVEDELAKRRAAKRRQLG